MAGGRALLAAGAGGALGTLGRYQLGLAVAASAGAWPLATFIVNLSGALLITAVLVAVTERRPDLARYRPLVATGILGGWTTMSSLAVDAGLLVRGHRAGLATVYVLATIGGSALLVPLGAVLGRRVRRR